MKLHHYNEMVAYLTRPRQKYNNGGSVLPKEKPSAEQIKKIQWRNKLKLLQKVKDGIGRREWLNLVSEHLNDGVEEEIITREQFNTALSPLFGQAGEGQTKALEQDDSMPIKDVLEIQGEKREDYPPYLLADGGRIKAADGLAVQTLNPAFPTKDPTDIDSFKPLDLVGAIIPPLAIGVGSKRLKDIFSSEPKDESKEEIVERIEKVETDRKEPDQEPPKIPTDKIEKFLLKEAVDRLKQKEMDKTKRDDRTILARDLELDVPKSGLYELRKKENENFFQNRLQTLKDKDVNFDGYYSTREIANLLGIKTNSGVDDFIKRKNVPSVKQQGLYKVVKLNDFLNAYQPTKERIQAASELDARTKARSNFISEAAKGGFYDRFKKLRQPKFLPTEVKEVYDKYNLSEIEGGHPFPIEFFTKKYGKGNILQDERQFDWIHRNKDKLFDKNDLVFQSKDVNTLYRNKISKLKNLYKELGPLVDKYEGKGPVTNEKDINKIANLNLKIMKIATDSEGDAKKFIEKSPNSRDLPRMSKGGLHGAIFDYETGEVSLYAPGKEAGFVKGSVGEIETEKGVVPGEKLKLAGDYLDIINQVITDQGDKKLFTDFIQQKLLPRFQKGGPVYGKYAKQIAGIS